MRRFIWLCLLFVGMSATHAVAEQPGSCNDIKSDLKGPFVYTKVDDLQGKEKVFSGTCANLVNYYTYAGVTKDWREGEKVKGNNSIKKGTAIATFVDGVYPNKPSGNHAALYISQDKDGIKVMDQWDDAEKKTISARTLPFLGKNADGAYKNPSNNGDAFSIVLRKK